MNISKPPRQAEQLTILFAGLSTEATEEDIKEFLQEYEGIEDIRLVMNNEGSRGLAFIEFNNQ